MDEIFGKRRVAELGKHPGAEDYPRSGRNRYSYDASEEDTHTFTRKLAVGDAISPAIRRAPSWSFRASASSHSSVTGHTHGSGGRRLRAEVRRRLRLTRAGGCRPAEGQSPDS